MKYDKKKETSLQRLVLSLALARKGLRKEVIAYAKTQRRHLPVQAPLPREDYTGKVEAYSENQAKYRFREQCGLHMEDDVCLKVIRIGDAEEAKLYPRDLD